jgi:acyl carrier protein
MIAYRKELESVFREVFDDEKIVLSPEMTASDFEGWDSSQHVTLMIAIETRFDIRFATGEILQLMTEGSNIGTMLDILQEKLGDLQTEMPRSA